MTTIFAPSALLPDGWADNVLIEVDKDGWIVGIDSFKPVPASGDGVDIVTGPVVPGMANVHSHAFQRAMAGLAERASGKKDNFWGWRETMYRFLGALTPENMHDIALYLYIDMLKRGYTTVGEFHYVHHQQDGRPYDDIALMSRQLIHAAEGAGIAITHFPTLYAYAGFGAAPPAAGQVRFINDVPRLMRIVEELDAEFKAVPQVSLGLALHSLRAVSPDMMQEALTSFRAILPDAPVHIHAAEQMQEVESCLAWSGKRPVEWLLDSGHVDDKWCLIHATHMTPEEVGRLAASGAVVGLCPTTEANLGDGIFPLVDFAAAGGRFAIGSDSHITVNMFDELRWLEYVQRLQHQARTLIHTPELPSVGAALFEKALAGGAAAMGRKTGRIETGYRADFLVLDSDLPVMAGRVRDHVLDTAIFAAHENPVRDVMAGGRWVIREGRHRREEEAAGRFRDMMRNISI